MKVELLPKSTATNAHELLDEVAALSLEEPKRMRMADQLHLTATGLSEMPACETVGCIAGWVTVLKGDLDRTRKWLALTAEGCDELDDECDPDAEPMVQAQHILGLSYWDAQRLFLASDLMLERQQTPEHARHVVEHIRQFQRDHADALKAKAV